MAGPAGDRETVDEELRKLLPPAAAEALRRWAGHAGIAYDLANAHTNGLSALVVCSVLEHHPVDGTRKIVLKLDALPDGDSRRNEYRQQVEAVKQDRTFADAHLVRPVREPVHAGGDLWFTFQELAADAATPRGRQALTPLTTALATLTPLTGHQGTPGAMARTGANAQAFADTCAAVVRAVLGEWARPTATRRMTPHEYLTAHLDRHVA